MERSYYIPANYLDSGYILNGRLSKRNAVEALALGAIAYFICKLLPIPDNIDGLTYYILIILPCLLIGATGIQDVPLSVFLMNAYKWKKEGKPYFYNNHGSAYHVSAAQLMIEKPSMRDMLAEKLEKFRSSMSAPQVTYVEGENFVFASDPELEALQEAEDRLLREQIQDSIPAKKAAGTVAQSLTVADSKLNLDDIMDNIVLQDIEGGD